MRKVNVFLLLFILCFSWLNNSLYAQTNDSLDNLNEISVDSSVVKYYYDKSAFSQDQLIIIDTTLNFFQRYDPLTKDYDIVANTMIVGGPHKNLSFKTTPSPLFSIGENNLFAYLTTPEKIKHYQSTIPYSEIFYTTGGQEENLLRVTLGNQLSERLYIGLDFDVETTSGLFTNQKVSSNQFQFNSAFNTLNKRYGFYVNYIRNRFKFGENGGLTDDYLLEQDTSDVDLQILSVNLNYATNEFKNNYFEVNQYITLGGLPNDTLGKAKLGKLFLNSNYSMSNRVYQDQDTSYYQDYYIDSLETFDSINSIVFNTSFGWTNDRNILSQNFGLSAKLNYQYVEYFDGAKSLYFNYLGPQIDIFIKNKLLFVELSGKYQAKLDNNSTLDIGNGDLTFISDFIIRLGKVNLLAGLDFFNTSPEIKTQHYYSNHFIWDNRLNKQASLNINGGVNLNGYQLTGEYNTISNYVYFNQTKTVNQHSGSISLLKLRLNKRFTFKKFGATVMALYQNSSNEDIIRVPDFTARASVYFTYPLFKGALYVHPGFDITYLTSYYGDGYDPALMQFHIQDDKILSDQMIMNFFINFKIKRARIVIAYNHFNTLWGKHNFLVSRYPQRNAVLKFGLSWRFYK